MHERVLLHEWRGRQERRGDDNKKRLSFVDAYETRRGIASHLIRIVALLQ